MLQIYIQTNHEGTAAQLKCVLATTEKIPAETSVNPMALSSNATTETSTGPSTTISSLSTTNSSSLYSSPPKTPVALTMNNMNNINGNYNHNNNGNLSPTTFGPMSPTNNLESSLSQKDIVIQLRQLSQDPHQQIHLINNTESLRILSDTLILNINQRQSIETCIISLQTLQLLAANPNYRDTLKSIPNLLQRIDSLCISTQQRVGSIAKNLKETINSKVPLNKFQQYQPRPLHKIEFTVCHYI